MYKILFLIVALVVVFQSWDHFKPVDAGRASAHREVIMYSLTTCGSCKIKARELRDVGIAFKEYYIDQDTARHTELNAKLTEAGYEPRGYGTPIIDVHGWILLGNPSVNLVRKYMQREG